MNTYDIGDRIVCSATFVDADGEPVDPDTVSFEMRLPNRSKVTKVYGTDPEVQKTGVGVYEISRDVELSGDYYYRFWSTGNGKAAGEMHFKVRWSNVLER
jgi:hypothetical protein